MGLRLLVVAVVLGGTGLALAPACDAIVDSDYVGDPGGPGNVEICERGPIPDREGCTSQVEEFGVLCTTCPSEESGSGRAAVTKCLPARCIVRDRCLECVDPTGRTGIDCCSDYLDVTPKVWTFEGLETLNSCKTSAFKRSATTTCFYPGANDCVDRGPAEAPIPPNRLPDPSHPNCISGDPADDPADDKDCPHRFSCVYLDGSSRRGLLGVGEPLPDRLGRRPQLPEPDTCETREIPGQNLSCTTCTRGDQSSVMSCHHAGAEDCDVDPSTACVSCLGQAGLTTVCDPPREE